MQFNLKCKKKKELDMLEALKINNILDLKPFERHDSLTHFPAKTHRDQEGMSWDGCFLTLYYAKHCGVY